MPTNFERFKVYRITYSQSQQRSVKIADTIYVSNVQKVSSNQQAGIGVSMLLRLDQLSLKIFLLIKARD